MPTDGFVGKVVVGRVIIPVLIIGKVEEVGELNHHLVHLHVLIGRVLGVRPIAQRHAPLLLGFTSVRSHRHVQCIASRKLGRCGCFLGLGANRIAGSERILGISNNRRVCLDACQLDIPLENALGLYSFRCSHRKGATSLGLGGRSRNRSGLDGEGRLVQGSCGNGPGARNEVGVNVKIQNSIITGNIAVLPAIDNLHALPIRLRVPANEVIARIVETATRSREVNLFRIKHIQNFLASIGIVEINRIVKGIPNVLDKQLVVRIIEGGIIVIEP